MNNEKLGEDKEVNFIPNDTICISKDSCFQGIDFSFFPKGMEENFTDSTWEKTKSSYGNLDYKLKIGDTITFVKKIAGENGLLFVRESIEHTNAKYIVINTQDLEGKEDDIIKEIRERLSERVGGIVDDGSENIYLFKGGNEDDTY